VTATESPPSAKEHSVLAPLVLGDAVGRYWKVGGKPTASTVMRVSTLTNPACPLVHACPKTLPVAQRMSRPARLIPPAPTLPPGIVPCVESPIPAALSSACSLCRSSLCAITSSALPTQLRSCLLVPTLSSPVPTLQQPH
jgi:hypothetical protein